MTLPAQFVFSQSSLQDFIDCPRRFELRYLQHIKWPAPITEPIIEYEHHIQQGVIFHQMIQQYLSAIPIEQITVTAADSDLIVWWQNFLLFQPMRDVYGEAFPEYRLSIPFAGYRLVAQYDLVMIDSENSSAVIFDWKTARVHPRRNILLHRAQSRLYPFLLAEAGFRSQPVLPHLLRMIYWFPNFPSQPEVINYNADLYQEDREWVTHLVQRIRDVPAGQFELTVDIKHCAYCNYRSLCNRGNKAGDINQMEDDNLSSGLSLDIDFSNLPEIQF